MRRFPNRKLTKPLNGMRFGELVAIELDRTQVYASGQLKHAWRCRCDCGREVTKLRQSLVEGVAKLCARGAHKAKTCSFEGCDLPRYCRGACTKHYTHLSYGQCKSPGCDRPARRGCGGWCAGHNARAQKGRDTDTPLADHRPLTPERFWELIETGDGCWNWQGAKGPGGYGYHGRSQHYVMAHRYSWEMHFGSIAPGLLVCHRCDNPSCARPDHLFLGTIADNNRDRQIKGRTIVPRLKLNASDAIDIRSLHAMGATINELASSFGITRMSAIRVLRRETWRDVP